MTTLSHIFEIKDSSHWGRCYEHQEDINFQEIVNNATFRN